MGRELTVETMEDICERTGKMNLLVESLRTSYTDAVKESLRNYKFNFVICDPRLPDNPTVYASDGFCKMSGYSREEVLGRNCRFLQGLGTDRRTVLELRDAVREERAAQVRILNYTKEGKAFWNLFHMAPVFSKLDRTVIHYVGVQTPISCQEAPCLPLKETTISRLIGNSEDAEDSPLAVDQLSDPHDLHKNVEWNERLLEPGFMRVDTEDSSLNGFPNCLSKSERETNGIPFFSSGKYLYGDASSAEEAVAKCLVGEGMGVFDDCKPQEPATLKATSSTRSIVSRLVEASKRSGEVLDSRDKQLSECASFGVVCSSLLLSLTRIQQSFVLFVVVDRKVCF